MYVAHFEIYKKGAKEMINSNQRKLALSGWLSQANQTAYNVPLKLQKFLFLYEAFSKVDNDSVDFTYLRGYQRGPVFSSVWGDYTKERVAFDASAKEAYVNNADMINLNRARQCSFLVSILSEAELSSITHEMNIWGSKKDQITEGKRQVTLRESDFDEKDTDIVKTLQRMYPVEFINQYSVYPVGVYNFLIRKKDLERLTNRHYDTLYALANTTELHNPVFVKIDEGRLVID